jgi:hypothetical protein
MKASHICCVILLVIFLMYFFKSSSSKMNSYYAPGKSPCSCNKPQVQGVYMPNMGASPPDSSKRNSTYNYSY